MGNGEVNLNSSKEKSATKSRRRRVKKPKHKRSGTKCKNSLYFKRKRLIRSLVLRKRYLKMNDKEASFEVPGRDTRWQPKDEIAFWKARALSLEFENKMLHKHIKHMYVNIITQNNQEVQYEEDCESDEEVGECVENQEEIGCDNIDKKPTEKNNKKEKNKGNREANDEEAESKPPEIQASKIREGEMKMLYGTAWRKILGMETAVQLNYDLNVEKCNISYWPVVPIKLY